MDTFFYSTHCQHCNTVIQFMKQNSLVESLSCISIDNRSVVNNQTTLLLENGKTVLLPPFISVVPALLLGKNHNRIVGSEQIIHYMKEQFMKDTTDISSYNNNSNFTGISSYDSNSNIATPQDASLSKEVVDLDTLIKARENFDNPAPMGF